MSNANQEIIEARLAGYIDDELDVAERAEIERHLQQNPQYRRLLDELRRGRQMLRAVPRETAPPEFADAFFAQLERSGLLDGQEEPSPIRMRLDAWPRWVAAAAVLFLTFGLAAIVYFMLPRHDARTIAYTPKSMPDGIGDSTDSQPPQDNAARRESDQASSTPSPTDQVGQSAPPPSPFEAAKANGASGKGAAADRNMMLAAGQGGAGTPANDDLGRLASAVSHDPRVKEIMADGDGANVATNTLPVIPADAVVMVVRADDPAKIQKELSAYLSSRNLEYQPVSRPVEIALNASLSGRSQLSEQAFGNDAKSEGGLNALREKQFTANEKTDALAAGPASPQAAQLSSRGNPTATLGAGQTPAKPGAVASAQQVAASNSGIKRTAPAAPPASAFGGVAGSATSPVAAAAPVAAPSPTVSPRPAGAPATSEWRQRQIATTSPTGADISTANSFVMVRRLSRLQARELADCLARAGDVREADIGHHDANAVNENGIPDGMSNIATSLQQTQALKKMAPAAPSAAARSAPNLSLNNDNSTFRKDAEANRGVGAGPATNSANTPLADATAPSGGAANAEAVRHRTLDNDTQAPLGATTRPAPKDDDADRLVDVLVVLSNSGAVEQNASPIAPAAAPATTPAPPIPATQPAPSPSPVPFSPAK